jgi:hypothetical protein
VNFRKETKELSTIQNPAIIPYEKIAGICAVLVGLGGLSYSVAFMVLVVAGRAPALGLLLSSLFLTSIGLLSTVVLIAIYDRLRETNATSALLALVLGLVGALGSAVHGGYDLAIALNPPALVPSGLPSQIDPRGLLTFAVSGIALFIVAWLIRRGRHFPVGLAYLGGVSAVLLMILYLGRLMVQDPTNPVVLVPAVLNGFLIGPVWYLWIGGVLLVSRSNELITGRGVV